MLTNRQQNQLIEAAIAAPSADNSQPFLFKWHSDKTLALWIDEKRSGKASDNRFVLSDIALGAVIENVVVKASSLSLTAKVNLFPNTEKDTYFIAEIHFSAGKLADEELANVISKRSTNRAFPFKGKISQQQQDQLTATTHIHRSDMIWFTNKKSIQSILPIIQQAETIRFQSKQLHHELFSTINFSNPNIDEGMHISVLNIEKLVQPFFKSLAKWPVMNAMNKVGLSKVLGFRSVKIPILFSPALAMIKIKNNNRVDVINGGRAIERFWLTATSLGLSVQPYAAPSIFSLGFINCEAATKESICANNVVFKKHISSGHSLMFFRIGYCQATKTKTQRRKPHSFIKQI